MEISEYERGYRQAMRDVIVHARTKWDYQGYGEHVSGLIRDWLTERGIDLVEEKEHLHGNHQDPDQRRVQRHPEHRG